MDIAQEDAQNGSGDPATLLIAWDVGKDHERINHDSSPDSPTSHGSGQADVYWRRTPPDLAIARKPGQERTTLRRHSRLLPRLCSAGCLGRVLAEKECAFAQYTR